MGKEYPINPGEADYLGVTRADGRFTMIDGRFGSEPFVDLIAKAPAPDERELEAKAFEDPGLFAEFVRVPRFNRTGDVVFNFPLSAPPPPPTDVTVRLFRIEGNNEVEITNGIATVGEEIIIQVAFSRPPAPSNLSINDQSVVLAQVDELNFKAEFTPTEVRSHTLELETADAFLQPIRVTKSFLVVLAGAGNDEAIDGPPTVISDSIVPRDGDDGVPIHQILSVLFSEPVKNVTPETVRLRDQETGQLVALDLTGTLGAAAFDPLGENDEINALTIVPSQGLKFGTQYELFFSGAIIDTDEDQSGNPAPNNLLPATVTFGTFAPKSLGTAKLNTVRVAMATIGNRAFVATQPPTSSNFGKLLAYDLSDPVRPTKIGGESSDTSIPGSVLIDAEGEEGLDLGFGKKDVVAVLSVIPSSGNSNITLFDVSGDPPFPYEAIFTTLIIGQGAVSDMVLDSGLAYVASNAGGLQVFDLAEAVDLYQQVPRTGESMGFEVSKGIFTKGMGFGNEAKVATVPITYGATPLNVTAVDVAETGQGRRAYVGGYDPYDSTTLVANFSTVNVSNPYAPLMLETIQLVAPPPEPGVEGLSMSYVTQVGSLIVNGRQLAVAIGAAGPQGRLAVVDVEDSAYPVVLAIIELQGGWGQSLVINPDSGEVFVSTPGGVEVLNLTDPYMPQFAGRMPGVSGDTALASQILVTANASTIKTLLISPSRNDFTDDLKQPSAVVKTLKPASNDVIFVTDVYQDNECRYKTAGPIVFDIEVTRHVGEVDEQNQTLIDSARLKANGFISEEAILTIAAYDVDSGVPWNPEIDRVFFNDVEVGVLNGNKNKWAETSFRVPIEIVKFPPRASLGARPTPALNRVKIEVDDENQSDGARWCTAADWGSLSFEAVSPIILVHGNNSDGGFFERQGFTEYLELTKYPFDNSINFEPESNFIHVNSEKLNSLIPAIVRSFGVDSVHLVTHSKGGLDSRDYLARYQHHHDVEFKVLSLTTLSTPHNGSVGADLIVRTKKALLEMRKVEFDGFPAFANVAALLLPADYGKRNLTTWFTAEFNSKNVIVLPDDVVFNVVAADMDINGNGKVDTLAEIRGIELEEGLIGKVPSLIDRSYQLLRGTQRIQYEPETRIVVVGPLPFLVPVMKLSSVPTHSFLGNDSAVTIPSGLGTGSLEPRVTNRLVLEGQADTGEGEGRNHASVADTEVASKVLWWIIEVEETKGDLK